MADDVEILGPATSGQFRMIACPSISHERRTDQYVPAGRTVGDYVHELGWTPKRMHARVTIDGVLIPEAEWEIVRPVAGQAVVVRAIPQGGGNGQSGGKQAVQIAAMLALTVAAIYVGGGGAAGLLGPTFEAGFGAQALSAGLLIGGSLAINALIPPPRPRLNDLSGVPAGSPSFSLNGASNQLTPFGRIPRVYGTVRMYPPLAALPYTSVEGNDQYLNLIFCFGYGPLTASDYKIGDTPLANYQVSTDNYQFHPGGPTDPPLRIVQLDVVEESLSVALTYNIPQRRTSAPNAKELQIDITFPSGLILVSPQGVPGNMEVGFLVEYRVTPTDGSEPPFTTVGTTLGVQATVTTGFAGLNNDLTFTSTNFEPQGNHYGILFRFSSSLHVRTGSQLPQWDQNQSGLHDDQMIVIDVVNGATTANAVIAAFNANPVTATLMTVTNANADNGTGVIILASYNFYQLSGGRGAIGSSSVSRRSQTLVRWSRSWPVAELGATGNPAATYDIRMTRTSPDVQLTNPLVRDQSLWTTVRTVQSTQPIKKSGISLFELKMKASDQLNGTLDNFNAVVTSILPDWDAGLGIWQSRPTSNPASIYRDVLQGTANRKPKTDEQLDLATIQDFHERCAAQNFRFNAIIDFQTTVKQLRQNVLAAGRGTFGMRDMKYSVIQDLVQATPVDVLTPRTTSHFKWTRRFLELPHALRVRFVDEDNNFTQQEMPVYADGYDAASATIYEDSDAGLGVTNRDQLRVLKKRGLAEAQLRADDYELDMDFAMLNVTRGDRVRLQQDVILAGLLSARIKSVTLDGGGNATDLSFDEPFDMADGTSYAARIRRADGTQVVQQIVTTAGEWTSVTFTTPIAAANAPAIGDLVTFGELGHETIDCVVKSIEPGPNYTAHLTLLDYAPAIQTAEQAPIPPYDPPVSVPATVLIPTIVQIVSDESVLVRALDGSLESRIVVSVSFSSNYKLSVTRLDTQFRLVGSDDDWKLVNSSTGGSSVEVPLAPVQDGLTYEIRVRGVDDRTGQVSQWTAPLQHTVIGKTSPPPDVETMVLEGTRLRWNYPNPPRDFAGFLVRQRAGTSRL